MPEDLGMKCLPPTAAEDLLEVFVRRYEKGVIILTTNRPLEDWGQALRDTAAAGAIWIASCTTPSSSDCREGAIECAMEESYAASR